MSQRNTDILNQVFRSFKPIRSYNKNIICVHSWRWAHWKAKISKRMSIKSMTRAQKHQHSLVPICLINPLVLSSATVCQSCCHYMYSNVMSCSQSYVKVHQSYPKSTKHGWLFIQWWKVFSTQEAKQILTFSPPPPQPLTKKNSCPRSRERTFYWCHVTWFLL